MFDSLKDYTSVFACFSPLMLFKFAADHQKDILNRFSCYMCGMDICYKGRVAFLA